MTPQSLRTGILISAMLAASAAFAGADIVKCVDQDGRVTLSDLQCGEGSQTVPLAKPSIAPAEDSADSQPADMAELPAVPATRIVIERVARARAPVQHDNWTAPRQSSRMLARDVETLKAARLSLQVLDAAAAAGRHQRLAGLN
jgi:hypothetical protein